MKIKDDKANAPIVIPASEWGPGSKMDWQNNRLIGASGKIYEDVRINVADLMREFPPIRHSR